MLSFPTPLAKLARIIKDGGSALANTYKLPKPVKVSDATRGTVLIPVMTNNKLPYDAVTGTRIDTRMMWLRGLREQKRKV
jgi:hypothetical protein